jgi:hypothetical protein
MKRALIIALLVSGVGVAALKAAPVIQKAVSNAATSTAPKPASVAKPAATTAPQNSKPAAAKPSPQPVALQPTGKETPMAQRVAVLGLLNKRNGLWRDLTMKPGEAVRIGDVVVRLRACETTAPWEHEQLTGAFVQMLVNGSDKKWRRQFSGWLYKETPSLNLVEHPIYDVWTKECRMRHPDIGPETLVVRGGEAPASSAKRSKPNQSPSI